VSKQALRCDFLLALIKHWNVKRFSLVPCNDFFETIFFGGGGPTDGRLALYNGERIGLP
jgi:hypothetical protein